MGTRQPKSGSPLTSPFWNFRSCDWELPPPLPLDSGWTRRPPSTASPHHSPPEPVRSGRTWSSTTGAASTPPSPSTPAAVSAWSAQGLALRRRSLYDRLRAIAGYDYTRRPEATLILTVLRRDTSIHEIGEFAVLVDDTGSASTTYVDTDATVGVRYVYRIRARNAAGTQPHQRLRKRQSPQEQRDPYHLGRYGLGLKTASISQARSLTVATRTANDTGVHIGRWDLGNL